jgi:tRNA(fMet)-specific endonuclease VapC
MLVLPDTNVWIDVSRRATALEAVARLGELVGHERPLLSAVCRFELENGVVGRTGAKERRTELQRLLAGLLDEAPFDAAAAVEASRIAAHARSIGKVLSATDAMIAGHAAALGATLLTGDARIRDALPDDVATLDWVAPSQVARGGSARP